MDDEERKVKRVCGSEFYIPNLCVQTSCSTTPLKDFRPVLRIRILCGYAARRTLIPAYYGGKTAQRAAGMYFVTAFFSQT
ncbi:hypothetical protein BABINDRAFT_162741 [Babjeviella inositovora NRRL Y-12698]|uniref:Uncharacterized protein n=1 Tax=Babjeviella inositovora NRRL Y-12698 TaxID=984486 RepID=A0A1E3QM47_9ASCO|nr:uncharacterized protein BABINDRAFT_162741 [Babjeviella inositovora NRRL Y-12698]ODQ78534.1 hypothetical protein BABINDRAFT_162741 [Babjeviella inositovora NRRL Y-12698]